MVAIAQRRPQALELAVKGAVLYRGVSPFVPDTIDNRYVVILTFQSDNRKTGDMAQIWIIAETWSPLEARKLGLDAIICGDCPVKKLCYVNLAQRPRTLYDAYSRGDYPDHVPELYEPVIAEKGVRFGAYGDPVLIPLPIVARFALLSAGHYTGYTHQWRRPEYQVYRPYFMASVETLADIALAESMGWRWYMVTPDEIPPGAVLCPHQVENRKYQITCNTCWACNGARDRAVDVPQRRSIVARPTGWAHANTRWHKHMEARQA